jgi:16S rRNA (uracil1498-N3)-methyltransferase
MRVPRIFQNQTLYPNQTLVLDDDATRHLSTVLRLPTGASIILFNGDGHEYPSTITPIKAKSLSATVHAQIQKNRESPLFTHLGQVISKGNHMDYTLQKSVELGVSRITPLYSERGDVRLKGEREEKKQMHWQKIIIHACQQCGRNTLPVLEKPVPLMTWIKNTSEKTKLMLDPKATQHLNTISLTASIAILIGSEGGFAENEIAYAAQHQFMGIQLGPRILRTETASLAMLTSLQLLAGDFNA